MMIELGEEECSLTVRKSDVVSVTVTNLIWVKPCCYFRFQRSVLCILDAQAMLSSTTVAPYKGSIRSICSLDKNPCCLFYEGGSTNPYRTTFSTVITAPLINTAQLCLILMVRGRWEWKPLPIVAERRSLND